MGFFCCALTVSFLHIRDVKHVPQSAQADLFVFILVSDLPPDAICSVQLNTAPYLEIPWALLLTGAEWGGRECPLGGL